GFDAREGRGGDAETDGAILVVADEFRACSRHFHGREGGARPHEAFHGPGGDAAILVGEGCVAVNRFDAQAGEGSLRVGIAGDLLQLDVPILVADVRGAGDVAACDGVKTGAGVERALDGGGFDAAVLVAERGGSADVASSEGIETGLGIERAVNGDGREAAVLVTEQGGAADVLGGNGGEAGSRIECAGDVRGANLAVLVSQGGWAGVVDGETVERSPRAHAAADLANFDAAVFVVGFHVTGQGGDFHSTEVIPGTNARRAGHGDFKIRLDAVRFRHFGQVDDEADAVAVEFGLAGGAGDDLLDDGIAGGADRELPGPGIAAGFRADDADVPQSIVHGEKFQAGGDGGGLGDIGAGVKAGA